MIPFSSRDPVDAGRYRRWLGFYLLFVGVVSAAYGFLSARKASGWGVGEWLTNYSAGFIRRGLIGEAILLASRALHVGPVWVALTVQIAVYFLFLWCVYQLLKDVAWSFGLAVLLLSPATLSFIVLDPPAIFKKEILLFAALGVVVLLLLRERLNGWQVAGLLSVVEAGLVLSHEPTVFYLPYFFAAVALQKGWRRAAFLAAVPAVICVALAVAVERHPGTTEMAETICASVGGRFGQPNQGVCGGSMLVLGQSLDEARVSTRQLIATLPGEFFGLYAPLLLLAMAPVVRLLWQMGRRARVIVMCSVMSFVGSLFLFSVALDWGRWIHMHVVCLMLLILMAKRGRDVETPVTTRVSQRWVAVAVLMLYATCWNLPAVYIYPVRSGYVGLCQWFLTYRNHGQTTVSAVKMPDFAGEMRRDVRE